MCVYMCVFMRVRVTAAWEVMPPRAVRIPSDVAMLQSYLTFVAVMLQWCDDLHDKLYWICTLSSGKVVLDMYIIIRKGRIGYVHYHPERSYWLCTLSSGKVVLDMYIIIRKGRIGYVHYHPERSYWLCTLSSGKVVLDMYIIIRKGRIGYVHYHPERSHCTPSRCRQICCIVSPY
jgi:ribosomal protein L39E